MPWRLQTRLLYTVVSFTNHEYSTQTSLKMFDNTEYNVAGIWVTSVFVAGSFASIIWGIRSSIFDLTLYVSSPISPTLKNITSIFEPCRCPFHILRNVLNPSLTTPAVNDGLEAFRIVVASVVGLVPRASVSAARTGTSLTKLRNRDYAQTGNTSVSESTVCPLSYR